MFLKAIHNAIGEPVAFLLTQSLANPTNQLGSTSERRQWQNEGGRRLSSFDIFSVGFRWIEAAVLVIRT
jgi:hypothetical protein